MTSNKGQTAERISHQPWEDVGWSYLALWLNEHVPVLNSSMTYSLWARWPNDSVLVNDLHRRLHVWAALGRDKNWSYKGGIDNWTCMQAMPHPHPQHIYELIVFPVPVLFIHLARGIKLWNVICGGFFTLSKWQAIIYIKKEDQLVFSKK